MLHPYRPAATDHILRPQTVCTPTLPRISSRWTPEQVLRRDTESGTFEHVNVRNFSDTALRLQQALLCSPRPSTCSWTSTLTWGCVVAGCLFAGYWFIFIYWRPA